MLRKRRPRGIAFGCFSIEACRRQRCEYLKRQTSETSGYCYDDFFGARRHIGYIDLEDASDPGELVLSLILPRYADDFYLE